MEVSTSTVHAEEWPQGQIGGMDQSTISSAKSDKKVFLDFPNQITLNIKTGDIQTVTIKNSFCFPR